MGPAYLGGTFGDRELSEILGNRGDLATNQPDLWFPEPIWAFAGQLPRGRGGAAANNQARDGICQGMPGPPVALSRSNTPAFARAVVNNHGLLPPFSPPC